MRKERPIFLVKIAGSNANISVNSESEEKLSQIIIKKTNEQIDNELIQNNLSDEQKRLFKIFNGSMRKLRKYLYSIALVNCFTAIGFFVNFDDKGNISIMSPAVKERFANATISKNHEGG